MTCHLSGTFRITLATLCCVIFGSAFASFVSADSHSDMPQTQRHRVQIVMTSSDNHYSYVGQPVTFTVTLTSKFGPIPDGETVYFEAADQEIGTGTTSDGVATFTTSSLPARSYEIQGSYPGDDIYGRAFTQIRQVVSKWGTGTILNLSPNPAAKGQPITYTATVVSQGPLTPTGYVRFHDYGLVPIVNGVATFTKTGLRPGTHTILATYEGDASSGDSTSAPYEEVVNP
jgi:large repetitive protein